MGPVLPTRAAGIK